MRAAWFTASWARVLAEKIFRLQPKDLWQAQAQAERGRRIPAAGVPAGATT
jgi:hypothetical protein